MPFQKASVSLPSLVGILLNLSNEITKVKLHTTKAEQGGVTIAKF